MTQAQSAKGKVLNLGKLREGVRAGGAGRSGRRSAARWRQSTQSTWSASRATPRTTSASVSGSTTSWSLRPPLRVPPICLLRRPCLLQLARSRVCSADCARLPAGAHLCALLRRRHYRRVTPRVADDRQGPGRQGSPPRAPPPPAAAARLSTAFAVLQPPTGRARPTTFPRAQGRETDFLSSVEVGDRRTGCVPPVPAPPPSENGPPGLTSPFGRCTPDGLSSDAERRAPRDGEPPPPSFSPLPPLLAPNVPPPSPPSVTLHSAFTCPTRAPRSSGPSTSRPSSRAAQTSHGAQTAHRAPPAPILCAAAPDHARRNVESPRCRGASGPNGVTSPSLLRRDDTRRVRLVRGEGRGVSD